MVTEKWVESRSLHLEEQKLQIQVEMLELEKQRFKWRPCPCPRPLQPAMLLGAPTFPNAIVWSDDNLIAVASGHLVTILVLNPTFTLFFLFVSSNNFVLLTFFFSRDLTYLLVDHEA